MGNDIDHRGRESGRAVIRPLLRAFAGFGVWSMCFVLLYGLHAVLCLERFLLSPFAAKTVLIVIWVGHLALLLFLLGSHRLGRQRINRPDSYNSLLLDQVAFSFMRKLTVIIDATGLTAVFLTGLPILFIKVCI